MNNFGEDPYGQRSILEEHNFCKVSSFRRAFYEWVWSLRRPLILEESTFGRAIVKGVTIWSEPFLGGEHLRESTILSGE